MITADKMGTSEINEENISEDLFVLAMRLEEFFPPSMIEIHYKGRTMNMNDSDFQYRVSHEKYEVYSYCSIGQFKIYPYIMPYNYLFPEDRTVGLPFTYLCKGENKLNSIFTFTSSQFHNTLRQYRRSIFHSIDNQTQPISLVDLLEGGT